MSILHESQTFPNGFCQQNGGVEVFNTYIQCNLAAPDGIRGGAGLNGDSGNESDDEIGDTEEPDRIKYKEALATIGALGREAPGHSLPLLCQLLENRLSRLHGQIQRLAQSGNMAIDKVLGDLYEDIHWLLLIAGNVLTLDTDGETAVIPPEIMKYSIEKAAEVNIEASLQVLASPGQPSSDIPGHESADPVIKLTASVFRLAEIERRAAEAGFAALLSPEVSGSIMWFLKRWALTYLSAQESFYADMSMAIVAAFGQNTEGAAWTTNFLLSKVMVNLTAMNSETNLVKDTIGLLVALVDTKERGREVLKAEALVSLVDLEASHRLDMLPSEAKRGLMKSLVLVGSACEDQASREQYWGRVLKPLSDKYNGILCRPDLKKLFDNEKLRQQVVCYTESFIGKRI